MKGEPMKTRPISRLALSGAIAALVYSGCGSSDEKDSAPATGSVTSNVTAESARGEHGEVLLRLDKEAQARMGLAVARLNRDERIPELAAFGRVTADPSTSFTLRAPIAGTLITTAQSAPWPAVGSELSAAGGVGLGLIRPRLTAVERGDIATRLAAARGELESSRAALTAATAALERTRALNAENKNASDRALEEAEARVKAEEARGAAALAAIETLQGLLAPGAESDASVPISVGRAGTVVEVLAHPGETVDAGAVLMRLESFDRMLARIDMPLDGVDHAAAETIRVAPVGDEERFVSARRVGPAASVDVANQGGSVLYAFEQSAEQKSGAAPALRPGQAVVAWIPQGTSALAGYIVPRSAVLRFGGKAWIYDQSGDEAFMRREIVLEQPTEKGWFVASPWAAAARVVVTGAAALLSEEILGTQLKHGEEP
jgi:hypothetical protein